MVIYHLLFKAPPTLPSYQDVSPAKYPITAYPAGGEPVTTQVPYNVILVLLMMLLCCSQLMWCTNLPHPTMLPSIVVH